MIVYLSYNDVVGRLLYDAASRISQVQPFDATGSLVALILIV